MTWTDKLERIRDALPWRHGDKAAPVPISRREEIELMSDARLLTPPMSVYETDKELIIHADVPGANAKSMQVHFQDGVIELTARTGDAPAERLIGVPEYQEGNWYRKLRLPHYVDGERARSSMKMGVLTVRVPKRKGATARAIPVRAG